MTLHIRCKNYKCPKCSAPYIPFKKDFTCPKCGESVNDFYDFIPELINSMKAHKRVYGIGYTPPAWSQTDFSDFVQIAIYNLFDCLEYEKPENEIDYINNWFDKVEWETDNFKKHTKDIAMSVYEDYKADRNSYLEIEPIKEPRFRLWKKFFKIFMP